MPDILRFVSCV